MVAMNAMAAWLEPLQRFVQVVGPFIAIGFVMQLAARLWPIRAFKEKPQWRLDWLGFFLQLCYASLYFGMIAPYIATSPALACLRPLHRYLQTCPAIVCFVAYFVAYDFFSYWLHRLQHVPWMWPIHAFHHSSRHLNWLAGTRESPLHEVLTSLASTLAFVVVPAAQPYFWGYFIYSNAHNSFLHSNIRVNSRWFNAIFMTGQHHFVHHAKDLRAGNSNFAFIFTLWDRLFGTWIDPATMPADFELGLDYPIETSRLMLGLPASAQAHAVAAAPKP